MSSIITLLSTPASRMENGLLRPADVDPARRFAATHLRQMHEQFPFTCLGFFADMPQGIQMATYIIESMQEQRALPTINGTTQGLLDARRTVHDWSLWLPTSSHGLFVVPNGEFEEIMEGLIHKRVRAPAHPMDAVQNFKWCHLSLTRDPSDHRTAYYKLVNIWFNDGSEPVSNPT